MIATKRAAPRVENDYYPTPAWCVDELLAELKPGWLQGKIFWEGNFVAYLLRLNFLGSQKRSAWWSEIAGPPDHLFVLPRRPDFTGGGGDRTEYAWFAWVKCTPVFAGLAYT